MRSESHDLHQLAARIRKGDSTAVPYFVKQVEPRLACIIRRVMRTGAADTAVAQRIVAEAGQLSSQGLKGGMLVDEITVRICRAAVAGLRAGGADDRNMLDTILGSRNRLCNTIR